MSHAASRRRGLSGNKSDDRLLHARFHEFGRGFFGIAADFADHDHGFGLGIAIEQIERIYEIRANDGVAADSDRRGLSNTAGAELINRLISQRARTRNDSDGAFAMNVARHNSNLAFAWRNNSGTIRSNQPRAPVLQKLPRTNHVEHGNAFGDANDQFELGVRGLHDSVSSKGRRHKNHRRIGASLVHSFLHAVEDGPAF